MLALAVSIDSCTNCCCIIYHNPVEDVDKVRHCKFVTQIRLLWSLHATIIAKGTLCVGEPRAVYTDIQFT